VRYIRNYKLFENSSSLTTDQIDFLKRNTGGPWSVNPQTGLIDVENSFNCDNQDLDNFLGLKFGKIGGHFTCSGNNLKTLEGSPEIVYLSFWCEENPLVSFEGAPKRIDGNFIFGNYHDVYSLSGFLRWIKREKSGDAELILTHHFFTPEVIKKQITKNPDFPYYVSLAWNTEGFKKTQEELKKILPENILVKIDDLWSIGGYL
jgi:hypothetical protein